MPSVPTVEVLVVGGGGGGGRGCANYGGGGGGAGRVVRYNGYQITGGSVNVVVGAAGSAASSNGGTGGTGGTSCFGTITAGGGAGGTYTNGGNAYCGGKGGCGIYRCCCGGGGGGGAGGPGEYANNCRGGVGGEPYYSEFYITGANLAFGGAGAMGQRRGNGCGSGGNGSKCGQAATAGSAGVVYVRYPLCYGFTSTGGSCYKCQGYCMHMFSSNGTFTISSS